MGVQRNARVHRKQKDGQQVDQVDEAVPAGYEVRGAGRHRRVARWHIRLSPARPLPEPRPGDLPFVHQPLQAMGCQRRARAHVDGLRHSDRISHEKWKRDLRHCVGEPQVLVGDIGDGPLTRRVSCPITLHIRRKQPRQNHPDGASENEPLRLLRLNPGPFPGPWSGATARGSRRGWPSHRHRDRHGSVPVSEKTSSSGR